LEVSNTTVSQEETNYNGKVYMDLMSEQAYLGLFPFKFLHRRALGLAIDIGHRVV
jgi:hypothetical protein